MSVTLDAGVNGALGQSQAMSQIALQAALQVQLTKGVHEMQESAVMTLISSVGLTTYDRSGQLNSVQAVGQTVNAVG